MANPRGNPGNKGGRRLGYTYEKDQLKRLRKIVDRCISQVDAIHKGKLSEKEIEKYKLTEKVFLKVLDKLHANKVDMTSLGEQIKPIPLLNVLYNNGSQEDQQPEKED